MVWRTRHLRKQVAPLQTGTPLDSSRNTRQSRLFQATRSPSIVIVKAVGTMGCPSMMSGRITICAMLAATQQQVSGSVTAATRDECSIVDLPPSSGPDTNRWQPVCHWRRCRPSARYALPPEMDPTPASPLFGLSGRRATTPPSLPFRERTSSPALARLLSGPSPAMADIT